ncbi:13525_t:CDS:2, partial [Gigaspora rosea]
WNIRFTFYKKCIENNEDVVIRLFGISQNPETLDYVIVMNYIEQGSLRDQLKEISTSTWDKKLNCLYEVSCGLVNIHEMNIVHQDFHSEADKNMSISKSTIATINSEAYFTSRILKYSDLPKPMNSVEIRPFKKNNYVTTQVSLHLPNYDELS